MANEQLAVVLFGSLLLSYDGFVVSLTWQNKLSVDEVIGLLFKEKMKKKNHVSTRVDKALFIGKVGYQKNKLEVFHKRVKEHNLMNLIKGKSLK